MGKPYCCPVCNGRGTVPKSFYDNPYFSTTDTFEINCKSCEGTGIVYGTNDDYEVVCQDPIK